MNAIPNNVLRQLFLIVLIILLGILVFSEMKTFIPAFLGAYTLYVLLRKWMFILEGRKRMNKGLAAAILMIVSFLVILLPCFIVVDMLAKKITFAVQHSTEVISSIETFIRKIETEYKIGIITEQNVQKLGEWGQQTLPKILGATFDTLTTIVIMYFVLYFMLVDGRKMESAFYEWVPLKDEKKNVRRYTW